MRITNKIMQNNSLTNLNNNKILQDKLNTQVATEKKISRPSEDPVIAIRALRLRTNLSEVTQYLEKNVEDALGWISGTEDALDAMNTVLQNMYSQCEKGNDAALSSESRSAILEQLKGLRDEVYATGDADYAGRTLFTGYRTNEKLRFQDNVQEEYSITEKFSKTDMTSKTYVDVGDLKEITSSSITGTTVEQEISNSSVDRILLSYSELKNTGAMQLTVSKEVAATVSAAGNTISVDGVSIRMNDDGTSEVTAGVGATITAMSDGELTVSSGGRTYNLNYTTNEDGETQFDTNVVVSNTIPVTTMSSGGTNDPYTEIATGRYSAIFVPETGEVLLSTATRDALNTLNEKDEISFTYRKENWKSGDLRPEHYFACVANPDATDSSKLIYSGEKQYMEYDVGYNQKMRVNTLASDTFTHDIGRTVDELMQASQDVVDMETVISNLQGMVDKEGYDQTLVQKKLDAANKALTMLKDKEKKLYASGMTAMQGYMAKNNLATTNLGNRDSRLALIKTRLTSQQTNFKGLVNENEGADVTSVAVELKSAETAYDAALLATSKIIQNSLINYI